MTWKIAKTVAGVLAAMPIAAVSFSIVANADPQPTPEPSVPGQHGEYYNPNDYDDWWYNAGADGGGGGGGGG
jgi:hypothetical protein